MFGSLLRDMERDPIFGAHSRAMSRMMNSVFGDFGGFGPAGPAGSPLGIGMGMDLMPLGMGMPMGQRGFISPFAQMMNQMSEMTAEMMNPGGMLSSTGVSSTNNGGPAFSHSQVSYVTMTSDGSGAPHVYQASTTTRQGPGGVRETRKAVSDSRSGTKKVHVGRHLGDRAHILEREENLRTGRREEHEDLINLDHEDREHFHREWRNRVYGGSGVSFEEPPRRSITAAAAGSDSRPRATSGRTTYGSGLTIEEVVDDDDTDDVMIEGVSNNGHVEMARAAAAATTSAPIISSPNRRHHSHRDRRQKSSKRPKRIH